MTSVCAKSVIFVIELVIFAGLSTFCPNSLDNIGLPPKTAK